MALDEELLLRARQAGTRWTEAQDHAEQAKNAYHQAVRRLHLSGSSLHEIAEALDISHQRVHQIIEATGGTAGWRSRRKPADPACGFCGAGKTEVNRLVAGPAVFICDACVSLACRVVDDAGRPDAPRAHLELVALPSALSCSFCNKPATDVTALVTGGGVRICDGCARFGEEIIAAQAG
ncbi:ClpX C4-type zinc finger protein [Planotetraspora kaengkrachanensis]|uniref:ClpX-type ZB domain-containing protein n=1 Tax=Planotetraspora kaengkrachanensis TaxID=575193 RepID=A0A8J3M2V8_9ACTN|nr:ClpX C4-type zinc finger protein [Planotetraspora kaengkrachanensis]GIG78036.1 hypothetical protein Pka01_11630 [Planotetraspora kaengkrachanensis]